MSGICVSISRCTAFFRVALTSTNRAGRDLSRQIRTISWTSGPKPSSNMVSASSRTTALTSLKKKAPASLFISTAFGVATTRSLTRPSSVFWAARALPALMTQVRILAFVLRSLATS